jgi:4a-hydroxytetrahydrobiopterin dehydratase
VNRLAEKAEEAKHHPDLENHYNRVIVALRTWDEDGVTDKDVALARAIESVAAPPEA